MEKELSKKEALFNEVKGSLFEYLVASALAKASNLELEFQRSLDKNYLTVLSQQDRLVREFYPEMGPFLRECAEASAQSLTPHFPKDLRNVQLTGKLSNSPMARTWAEADLILEGSERSLPVSLKLNKKNSFVNTKSGGVKSFFQTYFPFADKSLQERFSKRVDLEFATMAHELHEIKDIPFEGDFKSWVRAGYSELPGETGDDGRKILKAYYARLASEMHGIFEEIQQLHPLEFRMALARLMGFGNPDLLQLVCFHDFKGSSGVRCEVHHYHELEKNLSMLRSLSFSGTASVEWEVGDWKLQIRIKPMNKFTTTAIKINCAVKF